jgi:hypothetical protein
MRSATDLKHDSIQQKSPQDHNPSIGRKACWFNPVIHHGILLTIIGSKAPGR